MATHDGAKKDSTVVGPPGSADVRPIPIQTVLSWPTTQFNLYLKLADGRFLALMRKGSTVDQERLKKYQAKGIETLYASERELVDAVTTEVESARQDPRIEALNKASAAVFEELKAMGISEASFNHAKAVGKAVRGFVERDGKLADAFLKFQEMQPSSVRHSIMTSAVATILCTEMDWMKPATIENVALGALLHDIGKFYLPSDIVDKDLMQLNDSDRTVLQGHCELGRAHLSRLKTVPDDVLSIVAQHHERSDGSGYPQGIKDIYIHPLARVVAIANEIVDLFELDLRAGRTPTVRALVETLLNSQSTRFNRDVIKSLRQLLTSGALN